METRVTVTVESGLACLRSSVAHEVVEVDGLSPGRLSDRRRSSLSCGLCLRSDGQPLQLPQQVSGLYRNTSGTSR